MELLKNYLKEMRTYRFEAKVLPPKKDACSLPMGPEKCIQHGVGDRAVWLIYH